MTDYRNQWQRDAEYWSSLGMTREDLRKQHGAGLRGMTPAERAESSPGLENATTTQTTVRPALTPGEWARKDVERGNPTDHLTLHSFNIEPDGDFLLWGSDAQLQSNVPQSMRHALAALALYGQNFGFERDMVHAIRKLAEQERMAGGDSLADYADGIAARIAALLPPEG